MSGDNSKPGSGGDKAPGIELQVKFNDNLNVNIKADQLFDGAMSSMGNALGAAAGKQLPSLPKINENNNSSDSSFEKGYAQRKKD